MRLTNVADKMNRVRRVKRFLEDTLGCRYESVEDYLTGNSDYVPVLNSYSAFVREFMFEEIEDRIYITYGCTTDKNSPPYLEFIEGKKVVKNDSNLSSLISESILYTFYEDKVYWPLEEYTKSKFLCVNVNKFFENLEMSETYGLSILAMVSYEKVFIGSKERLVLNSFLEKLTSLSLLRFNKLSKEWYNRTVEDSNLYKEALKYMIKNRVCDKRYAFANRIGILSKKNTLVDFSTDYISVPLLVQTLYRSIYYIIYYEVESVINQLDEMKFVLDYEQEKRVADPENDYKL